MIFFFALLPLLALSLRRDCLQSENYWHSLSYERWPVNIRTREMCNQSWFSLMAEKSDDPWFVVFRAFSLATLNSYEERMGLSLSAFPQSLVQYCHRKSQWKDDIIIQRTLKLYAFNYGSTNWTLCPPPTPPCPPLGKKEEEGESSEEPTQIHERVNSYSIEEKFSMMLFYERVNLFFILTLYLALLILWRKLSQQSLRF